MANGVMEFGHGRKCLSVQESVIGNWSLVSGLSREAGQFGTGFLGATL
jgi:hypothetical protein